MRNFKGQNLAAYAKAVLLTCLALAFLTGFTGQSFAQTDLKAHECSSPYAANGFSACYGHGLGGAINYDDANTGKIVGLRTDTVAYGSTLVSVPVDVWNLCRYIDNYTASSYFVPFGHAADWQSVLNDNATPFIKTKCSVPYGTPGGHPVAAPPYGTCSAINLNASTPQLYARYTGAPGPSAETTGASFSCGQTTVNAGELWSGLDSDTNYSKSWAPKQDLYGPSILLEGNGRTTGINVDVGSTVTLSWAATGGNGENNISCTPTSWGASANASGTIAPITVTSQTATSYSITCTDNTYNLSSTATVTVSGIPSVSVSLSSNPSTVDVGRTSLLTWVSTNATSCTLDGFGDVNLSDSKPVQPIATTTYKVTCSNAGGSAQGTTTITVDPLVSSTLTAAPSSIISGQQSKLIWSSTNATSCIIDNGIGAVATSGSTLTPPLTSTTTYGIVCSNDGGSAAQSATVTVDQPVTVTLTADHTTILSGTTPTLTWTSSAATACAINNGAVALNGSSPYPTPATTTYTLSCTNPDGSNASTSQIITVVPNVTVTLSVSPSTILSTGSSQLIWSSTGATSCTMGTGSLATSGQIPVTQAGTYTMTCSNELSSAQNSATLTVNQPAVLTLAANPLTINSGASTQLSWSASNATNCSIPGVGSVSTNGQTGQTLYSTTTYTLNCNDMTSGLPVASTPVTITVCASGYSVQNGVCVQNSVPQAPGSCPAISFSSGWADVQWSAPSYCGNNFYDHDATWDNGKLITDSAAECAWPNWPKLTTNGLGWSGINWPGPTGYTTSPPATSPALPGYVMLDRFGSPLFPDAAIRDADRAAGVYHFHTYPGMPVPTYTSGYDESWALPLASQYMPNDVALAEPASGANTELEDLQLALTNAIGVPVIGSVSGGFTQSFLVCGSDQAGDLLDSYAQCLAQHAQIPGAKGELVTSQAMGKTYSSGDTWSFQIKGPDANGGCFYDANGGAGFNLANSNGVQAFKYVGPLSANRIGHCQVTVSFNRPAGSNACKTASVNGGVPEFAWCGSTTINGYRGNGGTCERPIMGGPVAPNTSPNVGPHYCTQTCTGPGGGP